MLRQTGESALNQKLTAITKGRRGILDWIQIPRHTWFYSPSLLELYHYVTGVFKAHPLEYDEIYHTHHTLKVLPPDAVLATVSLLPDGWHLLSTSPMPETLWHDITSQPEIERILLARNQQHLKQVQ